MKSLRTLLNQKQFVVKNTVLYMIQKFDILVLDCYKIKKYDIWSCFSTDLQMYRTTEKIELEIKNVYAVNLKKRLHVQAQIEDVDMNSVL